MFVSILIIYTIVFLIWLYAFFSVLVNNFKEPNNKIVWVLLLIFIPVTAILYPFIGRKQIKRENINTKNSLEIESSINVLYSLFLIYYNFRKKCNS